MRFLILKRFFQISEIASDAKQLGKAYSEFLRVPSLSCGLYSLPANGADSQLPHNEDEVYYVLNGEGKYEGLQAIEQSDKDKPRWKTLSQGYDRWI
jgi:hypothetical protein